MMSPADLVTDDEILIQHIIPGDDASRLYLRASRAREPPGGARTGTALEREAPPRRRPGGRVPPGAGTGAVAADGGGKDGTARVGEPCAGAVARPRHDHGGAQTPAALLDQ